MKVILKHHIIDDRYYMSQLESQQSCKLWWKWLVCTDQQFVTGVALTQNADSEYFVVFRNEYSDSRD